MYGLRSALAAVILVHQLLVFPTKAVHITLFDGFDTDICITLCAIDENAFTSTELQLHQGRHKNVRKQQYQIHRSQCRCNNEARFLDQQQQVKQKIPKQRIEDETSPWLIEAPSDDDNMPTASPTGSSSVDSPDDGDSGMDIETTFSPRPTMAQIPSLPTSSPRPVIITSAPMEPGPQEFPTPTITPYPSMTPTQQPLQFPTSSPKPTMQQLPLHSEAPSSSLQPTKTIIPMPSPNTNTILPNPPSEAPTRYPVETESPTNLSDRNVNDDYDSETNYSDNEPSSAGSTPSSSTEVTTPAKTNNESNDSNVSGGGKFGIVLLVGIAVLGVVGFGYMTIQRRLRHSYRGNYSSTYNMSHNGAETELGLWQSNARHGNDDDDGLL